jgi:hypothetical protein
MVTPDSVETWASPSSVAEMNDGIPLPNPSADHFSPNFPSPETKLGEPGIVSRMAG